METINIALAFEDKCVEKIIVLMNSILQNKTDETIHFHIIDKSLSNKSKNKIFGIKNCKLTFYLLTNKFKKFFPYSTNFWGNFILPDVIPVDKLIYLGGNTIVKTSLKGLWNIGLEDNYIAAVKDLNSKKLAKKFRLLRSKKFFDQEVMLINCKKWREKDLSNLANAIVTEKKELKSKDNQIILNKLLEGKVKFIDLKWNLQSSFLISLKYIKNEEYKSAMKNPSIVNYVGHFC